MKCKYVRDYADMRINFDFADLEAFLVVAETGSFVAAADHLGLSQSALSRRIRKLEEALGAALFERTTRSVRMTLAAKRLRMRARAMLDDARETQRELRDDTARHAYQNMAIVTVAAVPSAIPRVVIPAVGAFAAEEAGARVRILDLLANEVAEAVAEGRADFGVASWPAADDALAFVPVFEDRMVLTMLDTHPLAAGGGPVRWQALSDERLILPIRGSGNRALIDQALAREGRGLYWRYEVPRTTTALELVRAGLGVAVLPLSAVPPSGKDGFALRDLADPAVSRRIGIVERRGAAPTAAAARLRAIVMSEGRPRA